MDCQLQALKGHASTSQADLEISLESPFAPQIDREQVPLGFKVPQLESYDGSTDPVDHLESFKALMMLHGASDVIMCKAFPATLRKAAWNWFSGLQPGSIHSFEQLARLFTFHFFTSRRGTKISDSFNIKQNEGEFLREYVARFNAAMLEARDLNQPIAMSALKHGLRLKSSSSLWISDSLMTLQRMKSAI